ncbi:hypothetical protein BS47DRAFT_447865 [Hydnum rufescens UP504]|uniref:Uncharacterized protein n=1 Tax=Hydnum rufescens UP504 TaxID=1448309 RepID=A0A9P6B5S9_9AGAM|nr:hypothetical protein BS47DRAFT_447865 [Hydnum rufescens UP504]
MPPSSPIIIPSSPTILASPMPPSSPLLSSPAHPLSPPCSSPLPPSSPPSSPSTYLHDLDVDDDEPASDEDEASAHALLAQLRAIGTSADSSRRQGAELQATMPPLTPNQSSSSPFIIISPHNRDITLPTGVRIAQSSACDGDEEKDGDLDLPKGEGEIKEEWGEGRVALGPGFQLVPKRDSVEEDSPESPPKRRTGIRSSSPLLSPTLESKAGSRARLSSSSTAQDLISRALEFRALKTSPVGGRVPKTPNGWKSNASTDLMLNPHKAPLTPFARPTTPPPRKIQNGTGHGNQSNSNERRPFLTPPPKLSKGRVLAHESNSSAESDRVYHGGVSNSGDSPRRSNVAENLHSGDPTFRETFAFSPARAPLAHRLLHLSPSPSDFSHYKRSLLPPSPFRTPISASRLTRGDEGVGTDIVDPYDPSADVADELARLQEAPVTPMGGSSLFGSRTSIYQSPGMPSPGNWRMF